MLLSSLIESALIQALLIYNEYFHFREFENKLFKLKFSLMQHFTMKNKQSYIIRGGSYNA